MICNNMLVFSDTLYRCSSPSTLPWWSCIWSTAFSSGHLREFLERVQWRITKMTGGLKHLLCEERLRELSCSGWRRKAFGEISWMFIKCGSQVDGGELFLVACNNKRRAMDTNWNTRSSILTQGRTSLPEWRSTGIDCPEGLWILL